MKYTSILLAVPALMLLVAGASQAQDAPAGQESQTIIRAGSQPAIKGSAEYFTGNVTVTPLFNANDTAPYSGGIVTFEAGARSAWHTHPAGQRLIVTEGVGRTGVWCPPGVKHWHGAAPGSAMSHLALTRVVNGQNVVWLEKVTDAQYNAGTQAML